MDVNFSPYKYIYCLLLDQSWVQEFGYVSGAGSWMQAKQFQCHSAAKDARDDPSWHNDPEGVIRAKIARLTVSVEVKIFPRNSTGTTLHPID